MSRKCTRVLRGRGHSSTMLFAAGGVEAAAALFARSLTSSCLLSQTSTSNLFKNNFSTAASPAASPARPARVTLATSTWPCPSTTPWSSGEEVIFFFAFFSSFFYLFSRSLTFNLLLLSLSLSCVSTRDLDPSPSLARASQRSRFLCEKENGAGRRVSALSKTEAFRDLAIKTSSLSLTFVCR